MKPRTYTHDWSAPTSFGVWGGSAEHRARLALALARRIDPGLYWIQAEEGAQSREAAELSVVTTVPTDHVFFLHPSELAPQTELGNMASWFVRSDLDPGTRLRAIGDFLRLPTLVRSLLEGRSAYVPTKALVAANADLARPFYPSEEGGIRPFIEALNEYGTTVILTLGKPPSPNVRDLDYLLKLDQHDEGGRTVVDVECRQGGSPEVPGLFTRGRRWGLANLLEELGSP